MLTGRRSRGLPRSVAGTLALSLALLGAGKVGAAVDPARGSAAPPPRRIASANLASDEILVELVPADRLVTVTRQVDDPVMSHAVGRVPPGVTRLARVDLEQLVAAAPDLVVVSEYTDPDALHVLERSGLRVFRLQGLRDYAGYRQAILDLGRAVGAPEAAASLVSRYDATLARVRAAVAGMPRPRVLYWASGFTAGPDTAIGALIECAGGTNAMPDVAGVMPVGAERAFMTDPDVVLLGTWPGALEALRAHPLLSGLRAVRDDRIVHFPNHRLVTLSHHAADACADLAARLHPGRLPAR